MKIDSIITTTSEQFPVTVILSTSNKYVMNCLHVQSCQIDATKATTFGRNRDTCIAKMRSLLFGNIKNGKLSHDIDIVASITEKYIQRLCSLRPYEFYY
jgi:hypothetical protein